MSNELIRDKKDNTGIQGQEKKKSLRALIDLAIHLWRLENAIRYLQLPDTSPEKQRLDRHLAASNDSLLQLGIEYEDHTGELVPDTGEYALKVIEFIPRDDISDDIVVETIKPSVYFNEEMVVPGEVLVGIPVKGENKEDENLPFIEFILSKVKRFWEKDQGREK